MKNIKHIIVNHPRIIISTFLILTIISAILSLGVKVNTDNTKYLPAKSNYLKAIEKLEDEFGIRGTASLLLKNIEINDALVLKKRISAVNGVKEVIWLDDYADVNVPLSFMDGQYINRFYRDKNALFNIMFDCGNDDTETFNAIDEIESIVEENIILSGPAAVSKSSIERTNREIPVYMGIAFLLIFIILLVTTTSWIEPFIFLLIIGCAILLNMGTNIIKGEISQITFAAASLLQLAVSMDYSIFLMHRFHEERAKGIEIKQAILNSMKLSIRTIVASAVTTAAGFGALIFMGFRVGSDLGLVLVKGVGFSLLTVFTLLPCLIIVFHKWIEKFTHRDLKLKFKRISRLPGKLKYFLVIAAIIVSYLCFAGQSKVSYYYSEEKMLPVNDSVVRSLTETEKIYGSMNSNMLMVKKGDKVKEVELIKELGNVPYISNISGLYSQLGTEIPEMLVPENLKSKVQSENYSLITFDIESGKESLDSFKTVEKVREIADRYYNDWYVSGQSFIYKDLKDTTHVDFFRTNVLSAIFIFLILMLTFKSLLIPLIAVFVIELAIWINISFAYFSGVPVSFLSSIVIGAIQLGATVDYAILYISRYRENLELMPPQKASSKTVRDTAKSILTSGGIVVAATFSVYFLASIRTASEICLLIGRGSIVSMLMVFFVLPGFLILLKGAVKKTTIGWPVEKHQIDDQIKTEN